MKFAKVFTSPLQRVARTCQLSGFGSHAETDPDLVEWDYGQYEGLTSAQILRQRPIAMSTICPSASYGCGTTITTLRHESSKLLGCDSPNTQPKFGV
jgi:broad specificity phosphatase PhoE